MDLARLHDGANKGDDNNRDDEDDYDDDDDDDAMKTRTLSSIKKENIADVVAMPPSLGIRWEAGIGVRRGVSKRV
jgi:hypothetical protein